MHPKKFGLAICLLILLSACQKELLVGSAKKTEVEGAKIEVDASPKSLLKRKRSHLIRNSLSKVLALDPKSMCLELGTLPCTEVVHKVSLGGMNAYGNAQYRNPEHASMSSPIAFDRVVLSACLMRAGLDFGNPSDAIIFKDIKLSLDQRLVDNVAVDKSINNLYRRAFQREASQYEINQLKELYVKIYDEQPSAATKNWMALSCYAVLTSLENAFY